MSDDFDTLCMLLHIFRSIPQYIELSISFSFRFKNCIALFHSNVHNDDKL